MQLPITGDVFLEPANIELSEVMIHVSDDYLYDIVDKCRKKINESPDRISKIYFLLQTDMQGSPVEMMECYYNGFAGGHSIQKMSLKNGRIGLAEAPDHGFFLSENTANTLALLDLTNRDENLPALPLQFNLQKTKKYFSLRIESEYTDTSSFHIVFLPRIENGGFFSGEAWIDKSSYALLKINLQIDNATIHPFVPVWHEDSLSDVSLHFSESFSQKSYSFVPENISFSYRFSYHNNMLFRSERMNLTATETPDTAAQIKNVSTSGSLTFYDYENGFFLPHYKYDQEGSDYKKILSLPFNASFWSENQPLLYTEKQKSAIEFFNSNGVLINFRKNNAMKKVSRVAGNFFDGVNIPWSDTNRLALNQNNLESALRKDSLSESRSFRIDQYQLQTQIYLDENYSGDSVTHFSAAIFDLNNSYYNLNADHYTNCFLNIYFDLAEAARRKMEERLYANKYTVQQIDSIYSQTVAALSLQSEDFIKDSESGRNKNGLLKWNNFILESLGIDNMKIFGLK